MISEKQRAKKALIEEIKKEIRLTANLTGVHQLSETVERALCEVDRSQFVPDLDCETAYINAPLRIGYDQTISQPYIVALMTELLEVSAGDKVLEIGTGSGYQAAILASLGAEVYSVEIIQGLAELAKQHLTQQGIQIHQRHADGSNGWPDHAPFDAIIVTAASPRIPESLLDQLKPGGRMVIPVGEQWSYQKLMLITKTVRGELEQRPLLGVAFVPLVEGEPPI